MNTDAVTGTDIFNAIVTLAETRGVAGLNALPGCWEPTLDGTWYLAVNGHEQPTECEQCVIVPPFHAYVEYLGWPAGFVDPLGGGTFAAGEGANLGTFLAALHAAAKAGQP